MKVFLYGTSEECKQLEEYLEQYGEFQCMQCDSSQKVIDEITRFSPRCAIVIMDGAEGMEVSGLIRRLYPELPLLWFSNDPIFGVQSYRINVTYFSVKEQLKEKLSFALKKAELIR